MRWRRVADGRRGAHRRCAHDAPQNSGADRRPAAGSAGGRARRRRCLAERYRVTRLLAGQPRAVVACIASSALIAVLVAAAAPERAAARTLATFTWSVAPKFGPDLNGDLLPDDPHNSLATVQNTTHAVTFNACHLENAVLAVPSYRWQVDDGTVIDRGVLCTYTRQLRRGLHEVTLTLGDGSSTTRTINVRDLLIVSLGDSFASGEGAPDVAAGSLARWHSKRCHRSSLAAPARAARAIEDSDNHSVVTFVHVACSGATVGDGILGSYDGLIPGGATTELPSQVDQVRTIVGVRPINAVILGIGANDVGFVGMAIRCIGQLECHLLDDDALPDPALAATRTAIASLCAALPVGSTQCLAFAQALSFTDGPSAASVFNGAIGALSPRLLEVANTIALGRGSGGLGTPLSNVLLTPYHDPTRGSDGNPCDPGDYLPASGRTLPGLSDAEYAWAAGVVTRLNGAIGTADGLRSWTRVPGIPAAFATHGYCAGTRWVNRLQDSFATQGDYFGTLHPNARGHAEVAGRIEAALRGLLGVS